MSKKRTYSDEVISNSSSRKSSNGSIAISIDSRSYSIDSRSYSIDSRSYSIDSRSYSIDSRSYSIDSTEECQPRSIEGKRKNSNPLMEYFIHKDIEYTTKRRDRDMKLYSKSPDEPKTIEQLKKTLYIFKSPKK